MNAKTMRYAELEDMLERLLAQQPDSVLAWKLLGTSLKMQGKESLHAWQKATLLLPHDAEAHHEISMIFQSKGLLDQALSSNEKALQLMPDYADAHCVRGFLLHCLGRFDAAQACYHQALAINPDVADTRFHYSLSLLLQGDFLSGWQYYESRWDATGFEKRKAFSQPLWLGDADLRGKTILLHVEQGLGDTLQFIRYVSKLADLGANVILGVQPALKFLLRNMPGISGTYTNAGALPHFDYHCPLMSLPLAFKTDLASIPAEVPYIAAPRVRVRYWADKLPGDLPRVGLVWSGRFEFRNDQQRSVPLQTLAPLLAHLGDNAACRFFSLQKEVRDTDLPVLKNLSAMTDLSEQLVDLTETAAIIANLDLVITVDTAVAHLAGALGKPVWIMLPFVPDWRWMLDRDDSPWYPTARLFRQPALGDWDSVVTNIQTALTSLSRSG